MQQQIEQELKLLPEGKLFIQQKNSRFYFRRYLDGKNTGITKDIQLVHKLARKRCLEYVKQELDNKKTTVSRRGVWKYSSLKDFLSLCRNAGLDIMQITCNTQQYKWLTAPYRKNDSFKEELKYKTNRGVFVRSKSEQIIGNMLEKYGIPYRYEFGRNINVSNMENVELYRGDGWKTYYPDFTIMLPDGRLIIWEHLGRGDLELYRIHNAEKIFAYREFGDIEFDQLILTFESDMFDVSKIEGIVRDVIIKQAGGFLEYLWLSGNLANSIL